MEFWKMNGAGNDFLIINNMKEHIDPALFPQIAKTLCERHLSIGADGFMVVDSPSQGGDYRMLFFNSDGSIGEMCGNGARCICRYGFENGLAGEVQTVETTAGIVTGQRISNRRYRVRLNDPTTIDLNRPIEVNGKIYQTAYVELGNPGLPHSVVHYPGLSDADENELRELGRALRWSKAYPKGANVNFYDLHPDGSILERTFERGVEDFTYACGTGTGSVAAVLSTKGQLPGGVLEADMTGGHLSVEVLRDGSRITDLYLTGPTNIVAKGEVTDEDLFLAK